TLNFSGAEPVLHGRRSWLDGDSLSSGREQLGLRRGGAAQGGQQARGPGVASAGGEPRAHLRLAAAYRILRAADRAVAQPRLREQDLEQVLQLEEAQHDDGEGEDEPDRAPEVSHAGSPDTRRSPAPPRRPPRCRPAPGTSRAESSISGYHPRSR